MRLKGFERVKLWYQTRFEGGKIAKVWKPFKKIDQIKKECIQGKRHRFLEERKEDNGTLIVVYACEFCKGTITNIYKSQEAASWRQE